MPVVRVWCGDCSEFMENVGPVVTGRDRGSQRSAAAAKTKKLAQQLVSKTSTAVGPQPAGEKHLLWYGMVNVDLYSAIITKVSNALYPSLMPFYRTLPC